MTNPMTPPAPDVWEACARELDQEGEQGSAAQSNAYFQAATIVRRHAAAGRAADAEWRDALLSSKADEIMADERFMSMVLDSLEAGPVKEAATLRAELHRYKVQDAHWFDKATKAEAEAARLAEDQQNIEDAAYKRGYAAHGVADTYHDEAFREVREMLGMDSNSDYKEAGKRLARLRAPVGGGLREAAQGALDCEMADRMCFDCKKRLRAALASEGGEKGE